VPPPTPGIGVGGLVEASTTATVLIVEPRLIGSLNVATIGCASGMFVCPSRGEILRSTGP
jgi:hypothetical protein